MMEPLTNPKTKTNSMDWNMGLGEVGNEHCAGKVLDDSDDFTPLPLDNFIHGETSSDKAAEQLLYHVATPGDKAPLPAENSPYGRRTEPSPSPADKLKGKGTGGRSLKTRMKKKKNKPKPKDLPRPPLSAYNIFFQKHRPEMMEMMKECSKSKSLPLGKGELGRVMGQKWRKLSDEERRKYHAIAEADLIRHRKEMKAYREACRKKIECENGPKIPLLGGYSPNHSIVSPSSDSSSSETAKSAAVVSPPSCRPSVISSSLPETQIPKYWKPATFVQPSSNFAFNHGERFRSYGHNLSHVFDTKPNEALPSEVYLLDGQGAKKKYYVTYKCHRMSKAEALNYTNRMVAAEVNGYGYNLQSRIISSGFRGWNPLFSPRKRNLFE